MHLSNLLFFLILFIIPFIALFLVFWIWVFVDCLSSDMDAKNKLFWILIIIVFNILGAAAYLIIARTMKKSAIKNIKFKGKKLYRSRGNRIIAGVCGGIGEFFNIDPTIIRLLWVLFMFMGGSGIIAYIICWIIIPEKP